MLAEDHREILLWTLLHRGLLLIVLICTANLQLPFDSSAWLLLELDSTASSSTSISTSLCLPLLRWDSLHFLALASPRPLPLPSATSYDGLTPDEALGGGLQYDYSFAFQPGIVWLLRWLGYPYWSSKEAFSWNPCQAVLSVSILAGILSLCLPLMLYSVTKRLFNDRRFGRIAALLSILSPSPCTLFTPTPEPFFAFFAMLGYVFLSYSFLHPLSATSLSAIAFSLGTAFRSNGLLLAGYIYWTLYWQKSARSSRLRNICSPFIGIVSVSPLICSQYFAWSRFCQLSQDLQNPWCRNTIPSIYAFVQDRYWNVGFFRYWCLAQIPNWILAAPTLALAVYWLYFQHCHEMWSAIVWTLKPTTAKRQSQRSMAIMSYSHYTLISLLILIFASHVQIALRFASPGGLPTVWWGAASILLNSNQRRIPYLGFTWSDMMITYLCLWNIASVILFAGFYPPA